MKKVLFLLNIIIVIFFTEGCNNSPSKELYVNADSCIQIPFSGDTLNIPVKCNESSKVSLTYDSINDTGWIFVLPTVLKGNGIITLWVQSYSDIMNDRSATLMIKSDDRIKIIKLKQLAKPYVGIDPIGIVAINDEKTYNVKVTCKGKWSASVDNASSSWCALSNAEGEGIGNFSIDVSKLTTDEERTAIVTIASGNLKTTLSVQQGFGVVINGLLWAKCDVGEPGCFTSSPDERGLLYQYDSKIGYSNSSPNVSDCPQGYRTGAYVLGDSWSTENDPCPPGWRIPTDEEVNDLLGSTSSPKYAWIEPANSSFLIPGAIVGIPTSEAQKAQKGNMRGGIFLPQSGYRDRDTGRQDVWWPANITTCTRPGQNWDRWVYWVDNNGNAGRYIAGNAAAYPIRCVADIK